MRYFACLLALLCASLCMAQNREIPGKKLSKPPTIDGTVTPEEWSEAAVTANFVDPVTAKETDFPTQVYAGYDATNLYVAYIATDPEPNLIRADEYRRQGNLESDDRIVLIINPHGTYREEQFDEFNVNPRGGMVVEFGGGRAAKREWQGEWEAKARITQTGYEVEIRIPWKILRLPPPGKRDVTINFGRFVPRKQLQTLWSNIGVDERFERNGILKDVDIPQVSTSDSIQVLPYVVAGSSESESAIFDAGVDLRYQPGTEITALGTINPDFKNIENAVLGIEFSRFERLADESRPFFVEGSDYFGLGGMSARLFAPQRIGQIDFGAKAFGILPNEQSFGALFTTRFDEENLGVVRYRKTFGARGAITGGFVQYEKDGIDNKAYGVEGGYMGTRFGTSFVLNGTDDPILGQGARQDLDFQYRDGTYSFYTGWQRITENFFPRAGFAPRRGFYGPYAMLQYERQYRTGSIQSLEISIGHNNTRRLDGGGVFQKGYSINVGVAHQNKLELGVGYSDYNFEGEIDRIFGVGVGYPSNDELRNIGIEYRTGNVAGENYSDLQIAGRYKFPNKLSVSTGIQFVDVGKTSEFQHVFGISYELSEFTSLSGRAISTPSGVNWYLAYRQSGNLGTEYYLIVGEPNADTFQNRLVLKVVIPFNFRI